MSTYRSNFVLKKEQKFSNIIFVIILVSSNVNGNELCWGATCQGYI